MHLNIRKNKIVTVIFITILSVLEACSYNKTKEEKIMSIQCKEAYENLYDTYNSGHNTASSEEASLVLGLTVANNFSKNNEYERLEKECK